jgi:hypothetical protein
LPPHNISPELLIENLLQTGELPVDEKCLVCEEVTEQIIHVQATCERSWERESGGMTLGSLMMAVLSSPFLLLFRTRGERRTYGKDKIYRLPLRVCPTCMGTLRAQKDIKLCLLAVPEYELLLDKFPDAALVLER